MPRSLAKFGCQNCLNQIPRQFQACDASAQTNDIEIVVFNTLLRRKMVFNQTCADSFDFVRANRSTDATAANRHATIYFVCRHRPRQWNNIIRIVIFRNQLMCAEVINFVTRVAKSGSQLLLQFKSAMICGNSNFHFLLLSDNDNSLAADRSASTSARSRRIRPAGIETSPSYKRASISAFSPPVTTHNTRLER